MSKVFKNILEKVPSDKKRFIRISMDIADQIAQYLNDKGMTQKDLADRLEKTESEISKWLSGSHNFTIDTIAKIESAFKNEIIIVPNHVKENISNYSPSSINKVRKTKSKKIREH